MKRTARVALAMIFALILPTLVGANDPCAAQDTPRILASYTVPDYGLGAVQNVALPGSVTNDRGFLLGGIGSDLWRGPTDPPDTFWMVTDRGPNGQIRVGDANRRTFPVPEFTPLIVQAQITGDRVDIVQVIPMVGQSGRPVTGLSNLPRDERPYDYTAMGDLRLNPNGLDTEGLVRTRAGDFWLVDEYGPSVVHVDAEGKIIRRYMPEGVAYGDTDYPVTNNLPAIHGKRKGNRGFEAVAISADERTLFIGLQSPLLNPNAMVGNASRSTRILAFDIPSERVVAEYVYQFDEAKAFGGERNTPDEMKISAMAFINAKTLLVEERTDLIAKLYLVDIGTATNILGSKWNDERTTPALESLDDPAREGVVVTPKALQLDLGTLRDIPQKIEGMTLIDAQTIAIINDNDFDINDSSFDAQGNLVAPGVKTRILIVRLPFALPVGT